MDDMGTKKNNAFADNFAQNFGNMAWDMLADWVNCCDVDFG